jgi:hypothetical protein
MTSDLWLIDYEQVADDFTRNCQKFSEEDAETIARQTLRSLGLDQHEIDAHISEMKS